MDRPWPNIISSDQLFSKSMQTNDTMKQDPH